jgi:2-keto-4-pentenoate hydratase
VSSASADVARRLLDAHRGGDSVPAPTSLVPGLDLDGAYAIQRAVVAGLCEDGDAAAGWKVGLASAVGRGSAGGAGPIYGRLLSRMVHDGRRPLDLAGLREPRVEGEIAFVLDRPLRGPGVTVEDVHAAVRGVVPALEILASRLVPGAHDTEDFVADNASGALAVLGGEPAPVESLDLRLLGMVLSRNGEIVGTGAGGEVLGHPARSVAWLANEVAPHGQALEVGEIVLAGSLCGAHPVEPGDTVVAEFDRLGTATATFA